MNYRAKTQKLKFDPVVPKDDAIEVFDEAGEPVPRWIQNLRDTNNEMFIST